jgi:ribonucleotide monophosphatase NagD (HAD superfamily)
MAGKPFAPIYELSCQAASRALGRLVDPSRILCIGDGLPTDVQGAQNQGLDCLFVLGGIHAAETTGPAGSLDPAAVSALLAESGLSPRYAMGQLVT